MEDKYMKTPKGTLSPRQEELMLFLWDKAEPMTAHQMAGELKEKGWNNVTLFKTVQSLTEDNFLEVKGIEKTVKTYARKFAPSMAKTEYYGHLLASRGITKDDLPQIIASVIGTEKDSVEKEIDEMLQRL
jgi:uncharacterized protein YjbJ (UPF0337 family)